MTFYLHQKLNVGMFCFWLLRFGIRVSIRIPKFCIGRCPKINYVYTSGNFFYYKATKLNKKDISCQGFHNKILSFEDSFFDSLCTEIQQKHKIFYYYKISIFLSLILFVILDKFLIVPVWLYIFIITVILTIVVINYLQDQTKKVTVLFYNVDGELKKTYQKLLDSFQELHTCSRAWVINTQEDIYTAYERKVQFGAASLVQRSIISINLKGFSELRTNIAIPSIHAGRYRFYFLPDRIFVFDGKQFKSMFYSELTILTSNTEFIELYSVPTDTEIVRYTWQYVNKSGEADKRFKFNRTIPVTLYSKLIFNTIDGLTTVIHLSKPNVGLKFSNMLEEMANITKNMQR